jgi:serine/threonine protein kinase
MVIRPKNSRVEQLFFSAAEIDSEVDRQRFLDDACESIALRKQVERLLLANGKAADFLEQRPLFSLDGISDENLPPVLELDGFLNSVHDFNLPRRFGDYDLLEKIAHGGMGVVFKARQNSLNRIVALKMISAGEFAGPQEVERFHVEAEAAARLDHAGIVPVYDVGCHQGRHYYSMAFVDGKSLAERICDAPLPPRQAAMVVQQLATAIQVAHDQGIIHRDLKPGNVLMDEREQPRITDFGLAKQVAAGSALTMSGVVLGTPSYMPPEQASGRPANEAADIYALGGILYATLTGSPPFEGSTQLDTILQVLHEEPVAPRKRNPRIPRDLEAICLKCLEKNAPDRYRNSSELAADLGRFLGGEPIHAKNDWYRHLRRWTIREPVLAAHWAATIVLLLILAGSYWIWGDNGDGRTYNLRLLQGNSQILLGWAFVVWALQKLQNLFRTKAFVSFVWAAINPIFLTITLHWNGSSGEGAHLVWLLSLYFLLIVTTCFFRRVELVAITTLFSLLGYIGLARWHFEQSMLETPSYMVLFAVILAGTGVLSCLLTHRLRRLSERPL